MEPGHRSKVWGSRQGHLWLSIIARTEAFTPTMVGGEVSVASQWDSVTTPEYQRWWNFVRRYAGFEVPAHDEIHAEVPNWRNYI
jgi:hypothetical protein